MRKQRQRRHAGLFVVSAFVLALTPDALFAQATAGISGTAKDQTGAVLPGITVTATETATGSSRTAVTDDKGLYRILNLSPGTFELRAELSGFRTTIRSGISLRVGDARTLDIVMQLGEITESVQVTGETPLVERTSAVMGGVIENLVLENIPLNGRGFAELALTQPNVVWSSTSAQSVNQGYGMRISVSGMRPISNSYTLDGQDVADFFNNIGGVSGAAAGIEAVREFKVVTNPYSAEYGKTGAGEIQVVTRSGSNDLEGTAYEFHRNSALDTPNYFDDEDNIPPFRRNQFGFALGGPIITNKTFFFANYEGLRETLGTTRFFNVPDENAHKGFVTDPSTRALRFVGIAPNIRPLLDLIPLPTRSFGDGLGEYSMVANRRTDSNYGMVRVDHALTDSTKIYARYSQDTGDLRRTSNFFFDSVEGSQARYLMMSVDSVLSPRLFNSFTAGYNRTGSTRFDDPRPQLANPGVMLFTDIVGPHAPVYGQIGIVGVSSFSGEQIIIDVVQNVYQLKNDLSLTAGRHSMKFGGNFQWFRPDMFNSFTGGGNFSFTHVEGFLKGEATQFTTMLPGGVPQSKHRQWLLGVYLQDDIRISPQLALNAGVRYETVAPPRELDGRISNERDPFRAGIRPDDAVIGHPYYLNPSTRNFGPRLGLVWSVNEKTSVRAGFGMFFDHILGHHWRQPSTQTYPFFIRGQVRGSPTRVVDFPNAYYTQPGLIASALGIEVMQFEMDQPTTAQYTLNVQRELWPNQVVSLSYVGSRGWDLLRVADYNVREPEVLADGTLFFPRGAPIRSPAMERVRTRTSDAKSFYNSFSASWQQRSRGGLTYQASYTFSKSTDDGSAVIGGTDYTTGDSGDAWRYPFLPAEDGRGPSSFDVRHNFVFHLTYKLPLGAGQSRPLTGVADALFGGWSVSGVAKLMSGNPFSVSGSRSSHGRVVSVWGELTGGPPNLVPGANANNVRQQNPEQYFDPTVFVLPEPGFLGNVGRNALTGPGLATVDLSLTRNFGVPVVRHIEFRAEVFNLFNRANFGLPSSGLFDSRTLGYQVNVGRITSTRTSSRQIQLGVRVRF